MRDESEEKRAAGAEGAAIGWQVWYEDGDGSGGLEDGRDGPLD